MSCLRIHARATESALSRAYLSSRTTHPRFPSVEACCVFVEPLRSAKMLVADVELVQRAEPWRSILVPEPAEVNPRAGGRSTGSVDISPSLPLSPPVYTDATAHFARAEIHTLITNPFAPTLSLRPLPSFALFPPASISFLQARITAPPPRSLPSPASSHHALSHFLVRPRSPGARSAGQGEPLHDYLCPCKLAPPPYPCCVCGRPGRISDEGRFELLREP